MVDRFGLGILDLDYDCATRLWNMTMEIDRVRISRH